MRLFTAWLENGYYNITVSNNQLIIIIRFVSKSYTHPWKDFANRLHLVLHANVRLFVQTWFDRYPNMAYPFNSFPGRSRTRRPQLRVPYALALFCTFCSSSPIGTIRAAFAIGLVRLLLAIPSIQLPLLFIIFYYVPPKYSSPYNSFSTTIPPYLFSLYTINH